MLDLRLTELDKGNKGKNIVIKELSSKDIAVIGIALKMPLADTVDEFWDNLAAGKDCIMEFPETRKKDADSYMRFIDNKKGEYQYDIASYLDEIDKFDYSFFNISPREAILMDPNQRLFLEISWKALEDAGYGNDRISGSKTGVYLGYHDTLYNYRQFISRIEPSSIAISLPGNLSAIIASRIAYFLNLTGPSLVVDTACSSSLVAVHLACQGIKNGDCDMAVAGGVSTNLLPLKREYRFGVESSSGKSKAFDDSADGIGSGEGAGAVILKPLNKAIKHRDNIYAVIKGSSINQDGSSAGITAPNGAAQENVIVNAWKDAGINAETISFIETHGTGTKLGDPVEISGIQGAFSRFTGKKQFCAIGSVKSNIGHLDNTAGIAGFIKAVLQLKNKKLTPLIHFNKPNRQIDFIDSPVYINDRLTDWIAEDSPRRCGVSSFGLSGTNCHVILEEAPAGQNMQAPGSEVLHIFTLSAKSEESLEMSIYEYLLFLEKNTLYTIHDICYTRNISRNHYNYRMAILTASKEELVNTLQEAGELSGIKNDHVYYGHVTIKNKAVSHNTPDTITTGILNEINETAKILVSRHTRGKGKEEEILKQLCGLYCKGADIDWNIFYNSIPGSIISLPVYCFEKRRCWLDIPEKPSPDTNAEKTATAGNTIPPRDIQVKVTGEEDNNYTEAELLVGSIMGQSLGVAEININKNYFELGGDSLLAVHIVSRLKSILGKEIDISKVLVSRTIKDFALYLQDEYLKNGTEIRGIKSEQDIVLKPAEPKEYYDVPALVERFWFFNQLAEHPVPVNIFSSTPLDNINIDALKKAYNEIVKRHEVLRSVFLFIDGAVKQKILACDDVAARFEFFDLQTDKNRQHTIKDIENRLKNTIFDFEKEPLFKGALIQTGEYNYTLCFVMHHTISDGWSMDILRDDLFTFYRAALEDKTGDMPPPEIQFKDYTEWVLRVTDSRKGKDELLFWLEQLKDFPEKNLTDGLAFRKPESEKNLNYLSKEKYRYMQGIIEKLSLKKREKYKRVFLSPMIDPRKNRGAEYIFFLKTEPFIKIQQFANTLHISLFSLLIAALHIHIFKSTGCYDNLIAVNVINRENQKLKTIVGYLLNLVIVRIKIEKNKTVKTFLSDMNKSMLNVYSNKIIDINDLCYRLGIRDIEEKVPILMTMTTGYTKNMELTDFDCRYHKANFHLQMNMHLDMHQYKNGIQMNCMYDYTFFKKSVITSFYNTYINLLERITGLPDCFIDNVTY
ncbi:MAG: hypothetical protein JXB88_23760 [Spirochaetales bacterium]|nr:hypothetical protein [Spirochaetales bacterium]